MAYYNLTEGYAYSHIWCPLIALEFVLAACLLALPAWLHIPVVHYPLRVKGCQSPCCCDISYFPLQQRRR